MAVFAYCCRVARRFVGMAFLHSEYMQGNVDVAFLHSDKPWPSDVEEAVERAKAIPGSKWRSYARISNRDGVFLRDYVKVGDFTCHTSFGHRWFHVWEQVQRAPYPQDPYRYAVVKDYSFLTLAVICKVQALASGFTAEYALCSGRSFATHTFHHFISALTVRDIQHEAQKLALRDKLLESPTQPMEMLFDGFHYPLPTTVSIWSTEASLAPPEPSAVAVQQQRLDRWMGYLKTLTFDELDELSKTDSTNRLNRVLGLTAPMTMFEYTCRHSRRDRPQRRPESETTTDSSDFEG